MKHTALLVIDVQQGLLEERPYQADAVLQDIRALQDQARTHGTEVIFIRHSEDDEQGLFFGSPAWQIGAPVATVGGETIIEKRYSSAFKDTRLDDYLQKQHIQTLVVCGMQTEYCVDATVKSAFEHGYTVLIPRGCTTTFDASIATADKLRRYYEQDIWHGRFGTVIPLDQAMETLA